MLMMIVIQLLLQLVGMAWQICFYAAAAYWVAKMAHKGWRAGK